MPKSSSIEDLLKGKKGKVLTDKMEAIRLQEAEKLAEEQAASIGLPYIAFRQSAVMPEALALIPRETARQLKTVAFFQTSGEIRFGTNQPGQEVDTFIKRLADKERAKAVLYYISEDSFAYADKMYDQLPEIKEIIYGYRIKEEDVLKYQKEIASPADLQDRITKVNITDVTTLMLGAALKIGASDIHVEAEEADVKVRFRLDGILRDAAKLPREVWKQIIARLKLLAGVKMNIEDTPQDGRITIYLGKEKIDIRVSFLPTAFGESVVMRLLRPSALALEFDQLGLRGLARERLEREIARPNGMIITTGPTGSGKTTTLYAMLKKLNQSDVKIITLEDPIEYKLEGINQSQIEHAKHYDFAQGLRSILRQDPDVVMVGEIRDLETADIAIQAALTGHLVLSTIHTNSASGAIPRFLSMGVKPFLLAPALNAVIAQRLVRRLCPDCKISVTLTPDVLKQVKQALEAIPKAAGEKPMDWNTIKFIGPGKGCETCGQFGYKGRIGIYEIFTMDQEIEKVILSSEVSEYQIQELAVKEGMLTMLQDGLLKARDGLTSVDEVLGVANVVDAEAGG